MTTNCKPIVALASGAILVAGMLGTSAKAQSVLFEGPTVAHLADSSGNASGPTALTVTYSVYKDLTTGIYTYDYLLSNPVGDSGYVTDLQIGFNSGVPGALVGSPTASMGIANASPSSLGVTWNFIAPPTYTVPLAPNQSATLSFQSDFAPVLGNVSADGLPTPPSPWGSSPAGQQVAVPNATVPEPVTTLLLALGGGALAARKKLLRAR